MSSEVSWDVCETLPWKMHITLLKIIIVYYIALFSQTLIHQTFLEILWVLLEKEKRKSVSFVQKLKGKC